MAYTNQNNYINTQSGAYIAHIKPSSLVTIPYTESKFTTKRNFDNANNEKKVLSIKSTSLSPRAKKRLLNAVEWLRLISVQKNSKLRQTGRTVSFKISMITLTLPTGCENVSPAFFRSKLIHNFISASRYKFNLQSFVWRLERQKNGSLHVHFLCDQFINYIDLRRLWNKILHQQGLLQSYTDKFSNMSFLDYSRLMLATTKMSKAQIKKAYVFGVSTSWRSPNTTDVHSIRKIKNVGAYVAKYMAKDPDKESGIIGKIWACSYNLSDKIKANLLLSAGDLDKIHSKFRFDKIKSLEITVPDRETQIPFVIGHYFAFDLSYWYKMGIDFVQRVFSDAVKYRRNYYSQVNQFTFNE